MCERIARQFIPIAGDGLLVGKIGVSPVPIRLQSDFRPLIGDVAFRVAEETLRKMLRSASRMYFFRIVQLHSELGYLCSALGRFMESLRPAIHSQPFKGDPGAANDRSSLDV